MAQNLIRVFRTHLPSTSNPPSEIWDNPSAPVKDIRAVLAQLEAKGRDLRLRDVDEVLTAELGGLRKEKGGVFPFAGADAYYEWASSDKFITSVKRYVPRLILIMLFDTELLYLVHSWALTPWTTQSSTANRYRFTSCRLPHTSRSL